MKTLTKTLFAAVFTAVFLTASSLVALATDRIELVRPASGFKKLWVSGNVKIILTQTEQEGVFVEEGFNAKKTSVLSKGETLYINSFENQQVTIRVAMKDLLRIQAAGMAVVVTDNNFNLKCLQVILSQSAVAKVNAVTGSLYTNVSDNAKLKLSGVTDRHTSIASNQKNVRFDNFVSLSPAEPDTLMSLAGNTKF